MFKFTILVLWVSSASLSLKSTTKSSPIISHPSIIKEVEFLDIPDNVTFTHDGKLRRLHQQFEEIMYLGGYNKLDKKMSNIEGPSISNKGVKILQQLAEALYKFWYQPIAILLENSKAVHKDASIFLKYILAIPDIKADFLLLKFNDTAVTPVLANTTKNRNEFLQKLYWTESNSTTFQLLAPDALQGNAVFYAILKAINLLPEDSAIVVFTEHPVNDEDLAQLAVKDMLKKNIKLYVVWDGIFPNTKNELLKEAAFITKGDFLVGNTERELSELYSNAYVTHKDATKAKAVIAIYNNITHHEERQFPIDSGITSIHFSITCPVVSLKLISPAGLSLNLLNRTSVERFSDGSFSTEEQFGRYEIELNTAGEVPTSVVGIWRLDVDGGGLNAQSCNIIISVQSRFDVTTYAGYEFLENDFKKVLKVALSGNKIEIDNITILNKQGFPIKNNVKFTNASKRKESLTAIESMTKESSQEFDIDFNLLPAESFYLNIKGEDKYGKAFARLSYFDRESINYLVQPLLVEVGAGSELLVRPNNFAKIFFEITNNRDQVFYASFKVQDEKSLLAQMEPRGSWLNPKQTIIVTVTTHSPQAVSANYRNLITFTVSGPEKVQKSAAMYISTNIINDNTEPYLKYRYTSDCTNVLLSSCQDGTWVIEATAEDRESGLLQLTSNPKGLYFPNGYIAGTKEPVVGLYGGSCCQSKIQLIAIDLQNNRITYTADAYYATLSAGSISAIVLGIILFLIILIALICLCRIKCKKSKDSMDLPTYRGPAQTRYNNEEEPRVLRQQRL